MINIIAPIILVYFWIVEVGLCSIFRVHEHYIICHTPLLFWIHRKLILYNKIDYVNIYQGKFVALYEGGYGEQVYIVDIHLNQGKFQRYRLAIEQTQELTATPRELEVRVVVRV